MSDSSEKTTLASRLGHNFLTGLFLLLPIGLTLYVVSILLDLMGKFIQPAVEIGLKWLWTYALLPVPDFTLGLYRQLVVVTSAVVMIFILIFVGYLSKRLFGKVGHVAVIGGKARANLGAVCLGDRRDERRDADEDFRGDHLFDGAHLGLVPFE